ncbi:hypothetical protein ACU686_13085 [Yinghuangia aomiensis]
MRNVAAAVFVGLSLALAVPAAAHAAGTDLNLDIDGSRSGAVTIEGSSLVNPVSMVWDGNTAGTFTVGGEG